MPDEDDNLLDHLRRIANLVDGPPDHVYEAARAAFDLRSFDAELADLLFDSLLDEDLIGIRGDSHRQLSFGTETFHVEVDADESGLVGQLAPEVVEHAEIESRAGRRREPVDDTGRFFIDVIPEEPFRLWFLRPDRPVVTSWFRL